MNNSDSKRHHPVNMKNRANEVSMCKRDREWVFNGRVDGVCNVRSLPTQQKQLLRSYLCASLIGDVDTNRTQKKEKKKAKKKTT